VIARSTPPFRFGRPTGHDSRWLRTAPRRFAAGRYTTARHWVDPFELLAKEDPTGREIGAVLVQDGVRAAWSGAARLAEGSTVVEGVAGPGDAFMVGQQPPASGWCDPSASPATSATCSARPAWPPGSRARKR
jgi:hypothetical protein